MKENIHTFSFPTAQLLKWVSATLALSDVFFPFASVASSLTGLQASTERFFFAGATSATSHKSSTQRTATGHQYNLTAMYYMLSKTPTGLKYQRPTVSVFFFFVKLSIRQFHKAALFKQVRKRITHILGRISPIFPTPLQHKQVN